jgi:hypothetical protein
MSELPCDTNDDLLLPTHGPSFYLTLPCRTFAQAVRDVSKVRDLDDWVWEELHRRRHTAEVISLARYRAAMERENG